MSNRLDQDRQKKLQPIRHEYAHKKLTELGLQIVGETDDCITFVFKRHLVKFYPYSGWHTGKTIKDGRGIENLLKQLK